MSYQYKLINKFEARDNRHLLPHHGQSTSKNQPNDSNNEHNSPHKDAKLTKPPKKTKGIIPSDRTKMTQAKVKRYTLLSKLFER